MPDKPARLVAAVALWFHSLYKFLVGAFSPGSSASHFKTATEERFVQKAHGNVSECKLDDCFTSSVARPGISAGKLGRCREALLVTGEDAKISNESTMSKNATARKFQTCNGSLKYLRGTDIVRWQSGELSTCCGRLGMRHRTGGHRRFGGGEPKRQELHHHYRQL